VEREGAAAVRDVCRWWERVAEEGSACPAVGVVPGIAARHASEAADSRARVDAGDCSEGNVEPCQIGIG
jgi:hypothetical protein